MPRVIVSALSLTYPQRTWQHATNHADVSHLSRKVCVGAWMCARLGSVAASHRDALGDIRRADALLGEAEGGDALAAARACVANTAHAS